MKTTTISDFLQIGLNLLNETDNDNIFCKYIANDNTFCSGTTFKNLQEAREFARSQRAEWLKRA